MKKYIFISFLFLSITLWGQKAQDNIQDNLKGHFLVGLSSSGFNFQYIFNSDDTGQKGESFFSGDLNAMYLTSKKFGIGAFVSYRYNDFLEFNYDKRYYLVVGPQMRYYFNSKNKIIPFIEAGVGYLDFLKLDADGFMVNATLGSSFFLNKNVSVDAGIIYTHSNVTYNVPSNSYMQSGSVSTNGFGLQLGFSLVL